MWYPVIRPALFALDPERAHWLALEALRLVGWRHTLLHSMAPLEYMGLRFPNRVGLAAGFDKNAIAVDGIGTLGFGFIEVGTVTPRPQSGQPRPRLFRLSASGALMNTLGFPNDGAEAVVTRLRRRKFRGILGVNIGKNADTPISRASDDYVSCFRSVRSVADYVVVNVSSPNTVALRELQAPGHLEPLLTALLDERSRGTTEAARRIPLLVKISPDLTSDALRDLATLVNAVPIDGVIATNTTVKRPDIQAADLLRSGGVSGTPLHAAALRTVKELRSFLGPDFPIIGVGGIDSPEAAIGMRAAGADLVQLYTGIVYHGPALIARCICALEETNVVSK